MVAVANPAVGFRKTAAVQHLAFCTADDGHLKVAQRDGVAEVGGPAVHSYYLDGSRKVDVRAFLDRTSEEFAISGNPADYIFEVIRANTTNVPNENHDAFHRTELLRFDTRIGSPVYMTYVGKPHHINHRTENPYAARGIIFDAHYNDEAPPLSHCPNCNTKTAERKNRDETGVHCNKCGTVVKDEFVEILVGVDTKKDPLFARGVRQGVLKAGSMGCNCLSTVCNVCGHVAYSKPDFCTHIRAGNKGTLWKKSAHGDFQKISKTELVNELKKRGMAGELADFCAVVLDDFECRKAYENCLGVIFDEYSRVDQPADPKALQREILKAAQLLDGLSGQLMSVQGVPPPDMLRRETEALLRMAQLRQGEMRRAASAKDAAGPALPMPPQSSGVPGMQQEGDVLLEVPDEMQVSILPPELGGPPQPGGEPGAPGAPGPQSIEEMQQVGPPGAPPSGPEEPLSPAELGVMPPGAASPSKRSQKNRRSGMRPFAASYKGWSVKITPHGNACVMNADKQPEFVVRASKKLTKEADRRQFGREVLAHLFENGVVATAKKYKVHFSPKLAQVVDHAIDDMQGFEDKYMYSSVLDNAKGNDDMQGDARGAPPSEIGDGEGYSDDMDGDVRGTPPDGAIEDGTTDHELQHDTKTYSELSAVDEQGDDMRDAAREKFNMGSDSALDDEVHDHVEKLARLKLGRRIKPTNELVAAVRKTGKKFDSRPWTISRRGRDPKNPDKSVFTIRQGAKRVAQVAEDDLLAKWILIDKQPARVKLPNKPGMVVASQQPASEPQQKAAKSADEDRKKFEARLKKLYDAKIAKLEAQFEERLAAQEKTFTERMARAIYLVSHRQRMNMEASHLKAAFHDVLTADRVVGRDASTGEELVYQGMNEDLATHLIEAAFDQDDGQTIESVVNRSAQLMQRSDEYLLDAEAELQQLQPAPISIQGRWQLEGGDPMQREAAELQRQALSGNPHINPAPEPEVGSNGHDKRAAIRSALGGTKVESARGMLRN